MQTSPQPTTDDLNKLFIKACEEQQNGALDAAREKYLKLLECVPEAPVLLYNLGLIYFEQQEFSKAEHCFAKALVHAPEDTDILFNLALCQRKNGDLSAAVLSYIELLSLDPNSIDALYNLGGCYKDIGQFNDAVAAYLKVLEQDTEHLAACNNVAYVFQCLGDVDQAISYYKKVLDLKPDHSAANHMLSALTGRKSSCSPDAYVKDLFDHYSRNYDQSLVNNLEYCVPEQLYMVFSRLQGKKTAFEYGLDLGCGTGLSGARFAGTVAVLDGVDLSPQMIELAREKNIYRGLYADTIVNYLARSRENYDFLMAADVFGYIGDLTEVFSLGKNRARPDVLFCFSTENSDGEAFTLKPSGRFAHSPGYIKQLAEQTGWAIVSSKPSNLRKERGEWVAGTIWFLELREQAAT